MCESRRKHADVVAVVIVAEDVGSNEGNTRKRASIEAVPRSFESKTTDCYFCTPQTDSVHIHVRYCARKSGGRIDVLIVASRNWRWQHPDHSVLSIYRSYSLRMGPSVVTTRRTKLISIALLALAQECRHFDTTHTYFRSFGTLIHRRGDKVCSNHS
jgi:hypothetical protein